MTTATITLIEDPTALIELDGFRLLTDPTFDDPGDYTLPHAILKKTATTFAGAAIVPIHTDGWAHFTESGDDLEKAFKALGHGGRMRWLQPGVPTVSEL
jgi:hypothetical protein